MAKEIGLIKKVHPPQAYVLISPIPKQSLPSYVPQRQQIL